MWVEWNVIQQQVYTEIPKCRLGRKKKAPPGILIEHFLYENTRENVIYFLLIVIETWFIAGFFSNCLFLSNKIVIFGLSNELQRFKTCH